MKTNKTISYLLVFLFIVNVSTGCGALSGSDDNSSSEFSDMDYPDAVALYATNGLSFTETTGDLATSHNTFLTTDTTTADASTLQTALTDFTDDLTSFTTLAEDTNDLEVLAFEETTAASLTSGIVKFQSIDPSGVDSLNSLTDVMLAKKKECDALFALVPSLPSSPSDFKKLEAAQQCAREAQILALENGFDAAIIGGAGGVIGGAAGGAAVIYVGGTILSGGGLLVVTITGVIGSRIASYIWSACRSNGSGSSLKNILYADSTESCAISSGSGSTDSSMTLMATGTGTLQVFVADCAPIVLDGLTIQSGQTLSVNAQCTALSADIEPGDVTNNSDNASSSSTESTAVTCDGISGLIATNSPADPSLSDYVTVTATTIPPASGCSVNYSMSGTDGYAQSATLTTDAAGAISFTIPPAEIEGIVDTVITTESASGKSSTITYVF